MGFYIDRILKLLNMVWLRRGGGGLKGSRLDTFQTVEVEHCGISWKKHRTLNASRRFKAWPFLISPLSLFCDPRGHPKYDPENWRPDVGEGTSVGTSSRAMAYDTSQVWHHVISFYITSYCQRHRKPSRMIHPPYSHIWEGHYLYHSDTIRSTPQLHSYRSKSGDTWDVLICGIAHPLVTNSSPLKIGHAPKGN